MLGFIWLWGQLVLPRTEKKPGPGQTEPWPFNHQGAKKKKWRIETGSLIDLEGNKNDTSNPVKERRHDWKGWLVWVPPGAKLETRVQVQVVYLRDEGSSKCRKEKWRRDRKGTVLSGQLPAWKAGAQFQRKLWEAVASSKPQAVLHRISWRAC